MYDEVVSENVPDEFMSFLEEADKNGPHPQKKSPDGEELTEAAPVGRAVKTEP